MKLINLFLKLLNFIVLSSMCPVIALDAFAMRLVIASYFRLELLLNGHHLWCFNFKKNKIWVADIAAVAVLKGKPLW